MVLEKDAICKSPAFTIRHIALSSTCKQVILGGLLGDGSLKIQKNYKNARFQIRHSIKQFPYLAWKHKMLAEIALPKLQFQEGTGFSTVKMVNLQSKACTELTVLYNMLYKDNSLLIDRSWLDCLEPLALLIWWLDDGSLISNGRRGCFCTNGFSLSSQKILKDYFSERWDIECTIGRVTKAKQYVGNSDSYYYRLYLNNSNLRKLFSIVMPYLKEETMIKKFAIRYNQKNDQEHWISTMKDAMPNFDNLIEAFYSKNC